MGEKLLARRLLLLLRDTKSDTSRAAQAVLEWTAEQREWLWPQIRTGKAPCWRALPALARAIEAGGEKPPLLGCAEAVARLLELDAFEAELLAAALVLGRSPRLLPLRQRLLGAGEDVGALLACLAGARPDEAAARLRGAAPLTLGLLTRAAEGPFGGLDLSVAWWFGQLLDQGLTDEA
jgi:hypothetical protein